MEQYTHGRKPIVYGGKSELGQSCKVEQAHTSFQPVWGRRRSRLIVDATDITKIWLKIKRHAKLLFIHTAKRSIMSYTITLHDAPSDITERGRREAEERFRRSLEKVMQGPEAVVQAYRAWQLAEETAETELSGEDIALAKKWIAAATRAMSDGFRDLGESEAYFEVRIER
ncbi:hypothetical protein ACHFCA_52715 (plasmid) [Delftia tsuruhatensis]